MFSEQLRPGILTAAVFLGVCLAAPPCLAAAPDDAEAPLLQRSYAPSRLAVDEAAALRQYVKSLVDGAPPSPARVNLLATVDWDGLREVITAYAAIDGPTETQQGAFGALLERLSRPALEPAAMLALYSPAFATWLARDCGPGAPTDATDQRLYANLLAMGRGQLGEDLIVRLLPAHSLEQLAAQPRAAEFHRILEAWNRRLRRGVEDRGVPALAARVAAIAAACRLDVGDGQAAIATELHFLGAWPDQRARYLAALDTALTSDHAVVVMAALDAQEAHPGHIERNLTLLTRFADHAQIPPKAIRNYAFDKTEEHATTLGRIWESTPAAKITWRRACLFSMGTYPASNDVRALEAVRASPLEYMDLAVEVLKNGDPIVARDAVKFCLEESKNAHEEALRLAYTLGLRGFGVDAVEALRTSEYLVVKQAALRYLAVAGGEQRMTAKVYLDHQDADVRLSAIQTFSNPQGLSHPDFENLGPLLTRIALQDPVMGIRQEAIFTIGKWRYEPAREVLESIRDANPPVREAKDITVNNDSYWQHRFRLMAVLGLARFDDVDALAELDALHATGDLSYQMEVLLCNSELKRLPDYVWNDLQSLEPKLIATAAWLISTVGDQNQRETLAKFASERPIWQLFAQHGIDDHDILSYMSLDNHGR